MLESLKNKVIRFASYYKLRLLEDSNDKRYIAKVKKSVKHGVFRILKVDLTLHVEEQEQIVNDWIENAKKKIRNKEKKKATAKKKKKAINKKKASPFKTTIETKQKVKQEAVIAFQALRRYQSGMTTNGSIHEGVCITTGRPTATNGRSHKMLKDQGRNLAMGDAGHWIGRECTLLLLEPKNVHLQSKNANSVGSGMQAEYRIKLIFVYGGEAVLKMERIYREWKDGKLCDLGIDYYRKVRDESIATMKELGVGRCKKGNNYFPLELIN